MTDAEINALALIMANCTPMHQLSSMEARSCLEWLRGRGYLVKPTTICNCCNPTNQPTKGI